MAERSVNCTHYPECLSFAVLLTLSTFSCAECPRYQREILTAAEIVEQAARATALLTVVLSRKRRPTERQVSIGALIQAAAARLIEDVEEPL